MPSVTIDLPYAGVTSYFEDPSPYYPIWAIIGKFDLAPLRSVRFGRGLTQVDSLFVLIEVRIFNDGIDPLWRQRPIQNQSCPTEVSMETSSFHAGNVLVNVPSPGVATKTLVAVMHIYQRSWLPRVRVTPRTATSRLVASVCSEPVRFRMENRFAPHP